jgi:hypothetical protein
MKTYVALPADGIGTKVDVRPVTVAGVNVVRQRVEIASSNPQCDRDSFNIGAGQAHVFKSPAIPLGHRARLAGIEICGLAPWEADVQTVDNGNATVRAAVASALAIPYAFRPPTPDYITVTRGPGAGFYGFRVALTNLGDDANFHVTFFYDDEEESA